ncbi:RDD family protein [Puerhibacterium sp. TATVAM-FAB25]|uniref:RDD family protein n=1 Tax=Puerhibacterium sp. TATVAM-FAB25 TaxID=3093699 RepID=UPI0039792C66
MTTAPTAPPAPTPGPPVAAPPVLPDGLAPAPWLRRVVAAVLDALLLTGATWVLLRRDDVAPPSLSLPGLPFGTAAGGQEMTGPGWWHSAWLVLVVAVMLGLQAGTGWTPGKLVAGIRVLREADLRPAGFLRTLARVPVHLVDSLLMIGYLRPLWDVKGRTFADSALGTVVVLARPASGRPSRGHALTAAAAGACLLGAGFAFPGATHASSGTTGPVPLCSFGAPVGVEGDEDVRGDAAVSRTDASRLVQRLWLVAPEPVEHSFELAWRWDPSTLPPGDVAITTLVTRPGAEGTARTVRVVDGPATDDEVQAQRGRGTGWASTSATVRLAGDDYADLGDAVRVETALTVGGREVASCAVPSVTFDGAS